MEADSVLLDFRSVIKSLLAVALKNNMLMTGCSYDGARCELCKVCEVHEVRVLRVALKKST